MIGKQYEYDAMAQCEKELWWYKSLHEITLKKIESSVAKDAKILDAGCGTGGMLRYLHSEGYSNIKGFDLSPDAIDHAKKNSSLNVQLLNILNCNSAYPKNSFDIIISHDILCLLTGNEDKHAFNNLISLLKPGGLLLMNLPAGQSFKGTHDKAVGITKRYSKNEINNLCGSSVEIRELIHWPFLLSPLIFSVRSFQRLKLLFKKDKQYLSDVKLPPPFLNKLFYKIASFEQDKLQLKPWGSSIFAVLSKN
jgi:SAM-dependent methyltransferase